MFDNFDSSEVFICFLMKQSLIYFSYRHAIYIKSGRNRTNCSRECRFLYFITFVLEPMRTFPWLPSRLYALYSEHRCRPRSQRLICGLTRDTIGIYSVERETGEMVIARNETR